MGGSGRKQGAASAAWARAEQRTQDRAVLAASQAPVRRWDNLLAVARFYDYDVTEGCRQQSCYITDERALKLSEGPHYAKTRACHKNHRSLMSPSF